MTDSIIKNNLLISKEIDLTVQKNLEERLDNCTYYSRQEIEDIEAKSTALFPCDFPIPKDICNRLRALCTLSQTDLKKYQTIKSHRRFIGPVIVFIKKLVLKFLQVHLEDTFKGIEQFNAWSTEAYAKEAYYRYQLEKTLKNN